MSQLGNLVAGSRHDLHVGISPDAPDEDDVEDDAKALLAMRTPTRHPRDMTGPDCASCCSCRAACFAAPTATIPIPGI